MQPPQPLKTLFDTATQGKPGIVADEPSSQRQSRLELINFSIGAPSSDLLPLAVTREAILSSGDAESLQYGPKAGDGDFLQELARWLNQEYSRTTSMPPNLMVLVDPQRLLVTAGASQSLANIIAKFTAPHTTKIFLEDPTYFLAKGIFEDYSKDYEYVSVPMEDDGPSVVALEHMLKEGCRQNVGSGKLDRILDTNKVPFLFYCVPTFQNPTGRCMSAAKRKRITELSATYHMLVVCDDVYETLHYGPMEGSTPSTEAGVPRLFAYSDVKTGLVISNGSFSKIYGPGIRVGWVESSDWVIDRLSNSGLLASSGSANHFATAGILLPALRHPTLFRNHLHQLQLSLAQRRDAMHAALSIHLPQCKWTCPMGGYFFWVELPTAKFGGGLEDAEGFRTWAMERDEAVGFACGHWFSVARDRNFHCIRLSFAYYTPAEIQDGVERIARALQQYKSTS